MDLTLPVVAPRRETEESFELSTHNGFWFLLTEDEDGDVTSVSLDREELISLINMLQEAL